MRHTAGSQECRLLQMLEDVRLQLEEVAGGPVPSEWAKPPHSQSELGGGHSEDAEAPP